MKWFIKCLKQYADFKGRARRKEYWFFTLFSTLISYVLMGLIIAILGKSVFDSIMTGSDTNPNALALIYLPVIPFLIPSIAVAVRRLHDIGKSGWFFLLAFIPFVNFVLIVWMFKDSQKETNKWGPSPKYGDSSDLTKHLIEN